MKKSKFAISICFVCYIALFFVIMVLTTLNLFYENMIINSYYLPFLHFLQLVILYICMFRRKFLHRKAILYKKILMQKKVVDFSIFNKFCGNEVIITNIDNIITGILKTIHDDFIEVCVYKKDGTILHTEFVSCQFISGIKIIKKIIRFNYLRSL